MKKIVIISICFIILFSSVAFSQQTETQLKKEIDQNITSRPLDKSTHTVFAEYATTTWCPNCPLASNAIYEVYQETTDPFTYVTLVSDVNKNANQRSRSGFFNVAIPSVYFDGGYNNLVGTLGTLEDTKDSYQNLIQDCLDRVTIKDIDLLTEATWEGNAEISFEITITNNRILPYIGTLRTYISEIESRWKDYSNESYHHAMLDFAVNQPVFLLPKQTKTITARWDGKEDHNGLQFPDIHKDNIMISSAVFHIIPHYRIGYDSPQFTQRYIGFFADQADSIVFE